MSDSFGLWAVLLWTGVGAALGLALQSRALVVGALALMLLGLVVVYARRHVFDRLAYRRWLSRGVVSWGGEVDVALEVTNRKWMPVIWLRVRDRWPAAVEPLGCQLGPSADYSARALDESFSVRWFERVRRHRRGRCRERGVHAFGPAFAEAGDPFGIAATYRELDERDHLIVLPKVLDVPELSLLIGRPQVDVPARRSLARDPAGLVGVRPYRAGDPLRVINWRATARQLRLASNRFEPTVTAQAVIALNLRTFRYVYEGFDVELMELLVVIAASLAAKLSALGFAVGIVSNAHMGRAGGGLQIDPEPGNLLEILTALARLVLFAPPPFEPLLLAEAAAPRAADYIVVTPSLEGSLASAVAALAGEAATHVVYVGAPPTEGAELVDWRVPREFGWREADALPLG